ncbi:MAG: aspartate dehydrogenase [Alphaproteobacteria bacterium]|nr:aspartate dehydrogenase [Alphaproteobacteria bacterium]
MNILLIGFGAIGAYVADCLNEDDNARIRWVLCRPGREAAAREVLGDGIAPVTSLDAVDGQVDLAVDCAGHAALREHGPALLARGIDLITVSTGALADESLVDALKAAALEGGSVLELASGAIGAIDAVQAAKQGGLERLVYRGRKPPKGWKGSPAEDVLDLDGLTDAAAHFSGTARDAALRYPKNANVAASIAMAGTGLDDTHVELIADPSVSENIHEVEAEGAFGRLSFSIAGKGLPGNPRSSALTGMSVVAAIRRRAAPIRQ